jgi:hypothetical protein
VSPLELCRWDVAAQRTEEFVKGVLEMLGLMFSESQKNGVVMSGGFSSLLTIEY